MKKLFFSTGLISAALVAFSFASPQKNDAINDLDVTSEEVEKGSCSTKYETDKSFSKCNEKWSDGPVVIVLQDKLLDDY